MNYQEAKERHASGRKVYHAYMSGSVWTAGRMVDVGETIGYYATKAEALKACRDYKLFDFDKDHCETSIDACDDADFGD